MCMCDTGNDSFRERENVVALSRNESLPIGVHTETEILLSVFKWQKMSLVGSKKNSPQVNSL